MAWRLGVVFVICATGCQPLPPGSLSAVQHPATSRATGRVYLIRGWRDLWSSGIDELAAQLNVRGVQATVFRAEQWRELAQAFRLIHPQPLILIGFSYGADDVLRIAEALEPAGVVVDLAVTIDPVTPPPVPPNVRRCYNLFQTNGVWDVFPWLRGIPLRQRTEGAGALTNVDIRRDRPDLLEPNTSHATIAANPKVHEEIVKQVLKVLRRQSLDSRAPIFPLPRYSGGGQGGGPIAVFGSNTRTPTPTLPRSTGGGRKVVFAQ